MKAIVFDFDGTLTYESPNCWKAIWQELGYSIDKESYFTDIYKKFINKEINHQEWCNLTCDAFKEKKMIFSTLNKVVSDSRLIDGFKETITQLKREGFSLHIVSGGISYIIRYLLGYESKNFDSINANIMTFDNAGYLDKIIGTKYDFEGKAMFIEELKRKGFKSENILFIGNSNNDEWAYESGCKTLCINPEDTCVLNKTVWHNTVENMYNLREILPFISSNLFKKYNEDKDRALE